MITNNHHYSENQKLKGIFIDSKKNIIYKNNGYINSGYYFFSKSIFNLINNKTLSIEDEVIPFLIKKKKIIGIINNEKLIDIGTPKNLFNSKRDLPKLLTKPAVFLDRDGVINKDFKYVYKYKDFIFKKGVIKALQYLTRKKYYIFIVTNQAGIAKKYYSENEFILLHQKLKDFLLKKKILIHDVKYCPFHPKAVIKKYRKKTDLRKPGNLMIKQLLKEWFIKKNKSFMIGDQLSDKLAADKSNIYFEYVKADLYKQVRTINRKINFNNYF
jgi:D-glycero-D-manno-heptose 1,7-bisphosphate phosphatase